MTHLSDFSYLDRMIFSVVGLVFIIVYAVYIEGCGSDLTWKKLQAYNFKSVVIILYILSAILIIAADSQAIVLKYRTGFYDTCTVNCTDYDNITGQKTCLFNDPDMSGCLGIRTMPRDLFPQWALDMLPSTDACFNLACTCRTSALFLMLACFNSSLRLVFPKPIMPHIEVKLFSIYSLFSIAAYLILQFSAQDELFATIYPQLLYSCELALAIVFLILTNCRINALLDSLPRNFVQPTGSEEMLMYVKGLNIVLACVLFCSSIGLLVINADILRHGTSGPVYSSKLLTDLYTKFLNIGIALEPIIVTLIIYKPKVLFRGSTLHGSSLIVTSKQNISNGNDVSSARSPEPYPEPSEIIHGLRVRKRDRVVSDTTGLLKEKLLLQTLEEIDKHRQDPKYIDVILPATRRVRFATENTENTNGIDSNIDSPSLKARERAPTADSNETLEPDEEDEDIVPDWAGSKESCSNEASNGCVNVNGSSKTAIIENEPEKNPQVKTALYKQPEGNTNELLFSRTNAEEGVSDNQTENQVKSGFCNSTDPFAELSPPSMLGDVELAILSSGDEHEQTSDSSPDIDDRRFWQMSKSIRRVSTNDDESGFTSDNMKLHMSERLDLAKLWVSDAINAREPKFHRIRGMPQVAYKFKFSWMWNTLLKLVCFVQMAILPFFEPTRTAGGQVDATKQYTIALWFDFLCTCIFWIDFFLLLYTYGIQHSGLYFPFRVFRFRKSNHEPDTLKLRHGSGDTETRASHSQRGSSVLPLIHFHLLVLLIQFFNIVVALVNRNAFRLDRIARPFMVLFINPTVRHLAEDLIRTFSDFVGVLIAYLFICVYYGLIGWWLFGGDDYLMKRDQFYGTFNSSEMKTPPVEGIFDFSDVPIAWLNMFILTSLESYPDVMLPAYEILPLSSVLFFCSFIVIAIVFLQSIAVPLVYRPFQRRQRQRLLRLKLRERKALVAAFEILDPESKEELEHDVMRNLLRTFASEDHLEIMIQLLDEDKNGTIDLFEFFKIVDTIKLNIKVKVLEDPSAYFRICGFQSTSFRRGYVEKVVETKLFYYVGVFFCTSPLIVLLIDQYLGYVFTRAWIGVVVVYLAIEMVMMNIAHKLIDHWYSGWFYNMLVSIEVTLYSVFVILRIMDIPGGETVFEFVCFMVITLHFGVRIVVPVKTVARIVFVSLKLVHILGLLLLIVLLIIYIYAIIAMELFSYAEYTTLPNGEGDFSSFARSMLSIFQLTTGESWYELLWMQLSKPGATLAPGVRNMFVSLFFVSFNFITEIYILSIVLAVFLDAFLVVEKVEDDTIKVIYENDKAARTLGIPGRKFKLTKVRTLEEILYEDFLQDNQLNTIEELVRTGIIKTDKREEFINSHINSRRRSTSVIKPLNKRKGTPRTPKATIRSADLGNFEAKKRISKQEPRMFSELSIFGSN